MSQNKLYNFKNTECQEMFKNLTSQTRKLTECFSNEESFEVQSNRWNKTLNSCFQQSFRTVRVNVGGERTTQYQA